VVPVGSLTVTAFVATAACPGREASPEPVGIRGTTLGYGPWCKWLDGNRPKGEVGSALPEFWVVAPPHQRPRKVD
jgi:hypothetical protein